MTAGWIRGHASTCIVLVGVVLPIRDVRAQELRRWRGSLEASGHALFGAASSRLISFTAGGGRADSLVEVQSSITLAYADATSDDGDRSVTARSYRVSLGIDQRPFARISSFVFGSTEASLQQRVANRLSGGAGAKLTLQRKGSDDVSASLAILAERTRVLHPLVQTSATAVRTRWSLRVRFRRQLSDVVHLSHVLFYQPAVDRLARYTTESNTSLDVSLSKNVALMSAFRSRYDSEARQRGARSNHDGQLLFGVRATL